MTCSTSYFISGSVKIFWLADNTQLLAHDADIIVYDNNTATFCSVLDYEFSREEDQLNLTCSVNVNDVVNPNFTTSTTNTLTLQCEYTFVRHVALK